VLSEVEMDKGIIEVEALTTGVLAEIVQTTGHDYRAQCPYGGWTKGATPGRRAFRGVIRGAIRATT